MAKLDVNHFLSIYKIRLKMQEEGITNPAPEMKQFTKEFVEKLSAMPLDEEIKILHHSFFDATGNLTATIPFYDSK